MEFLLNIPFLKFFLLILVGIIIFGNFKNFNNKIIAIEVVIILLALIFLFLDIKRVFFAEGISLIGH
ncbi:MAG: hypothetical protein CML85_00050 [Rhodobiaceae bacterium]|nr:hypothetical protein [Rhodobiaceae bacterium]|tara:strand:- start:638 stop:838 length:201 start_codon:yes stop_codon:yes gene_type:complete